MRHRTYAAIVKAVKAGTIKEPFTVKDLRNGGLGIPDGTCGTFPHKHALGNPDSQSELFERVAPGKFRCVRPFRYGL